MKKILTTFLLALTCLSVGAQNVERVFDMDKLIASKDIGLVEAIDPAIFAQMTKDDNEEDFIGYTSLKSAQQAALAAEPFRVALSLSPFTLNPYGLAITSAERSRNKYITALSRRAYRTLSRQAM